MGKVLNNLVTEYINTAIEETPAGDHLTDPFKIFEINHDRNGWIFISVRAEGGSGYITIDSGKEDRAVLIFDEGNPEPVETMRFLEKGIHSINVFTRGRPEIKSFIVRSIPMIMISELCFAVEHPEDRLLPMQVHDWDFYQKYINRNVNVVVSNVDRNREWEPYAREWRKKGKKWGFEIFVDLMLVKKLGKKAFETYCYDTWSHLFEEIPYIDGLSIDEWTTSREVVDAYPVFARALDRIAQNPVCSDKKLYIYGQAKPREWYRPGLESIMRNKFFYLLEGYFFLRENPIPGDEPDQEKYIEQYGGKLIENAWAIQYPQLIKNNMVYVITPCDYHYSFDHAPGMDFRVFLDMQFHHLANHPVFEGLYGVGLYTTKGTTRETLMCVSALLRHYCIKGKRDRFNTDPLRLTYLKNPGFEEGLANWDVLEAEPESVKSVLVKDLPFEKRFTNQVPPSQDRVISTIRSRKKQNVIKQQIRGLEPGRLYSLTVYNADLTDFHHWKMVPVSIRLENVEEIEEESEDRDITTKDYKDGEFGCWNYHFRVFRAKGKEAELILSDWSKEDLLREEVGHEIIWDHINVQPYYRQKV